MKNKKFLTLFILLLLFITSCVKDDMPLPKTIPLPLSNNNGGVVFTFDDRSVKEWYEADSILSEYNWKATFFITYFDSLNNSQIEMLKQLESKGNEIGGHGLHHLNSQNYVAEHGISAYLNYEINPMLALMNGIFKPIASFAYPYGSHNDTIDEALLDYFSILRGTANINTLPQFQSCYFNGTRVIYGFGIDSHYSTFSVENVFGLLKYARDNDKIVIFYAHKPVLNITGKYQTSISTLELICKYANENNMKFYTVHELYSFVE
jgi:peptidoglycan/xylan/chitin deacetylase (PgdA/CDA1 family)